MYVLKNETLSFLKNHHVISSKNFAYTSVTNSEYQQSSPPNTDLEIYQFVVIKVLNEYLYSQSLIARHPWDGGLG